MMGLLGGPQQKGLLDSTWNYLGNALSGQYAKKGLLDFQDAVAANMLNSASPETQAKMQGMGIQSNMTPQQANAVMVGALPIMPMSIKRIPITGKKITLNFSKNLEKAPKNLNMDFGQKIEPAGDYLVVDTYDMSKNMIPNHEYGKITFNNPLVLEHIDTTSNGWKKTLSEMFGGKTGKSLSNAVKKAGYDGIITHDSYGYSEAVNINGIKKPK